MDLAFAGQASLCTYEYIFGLLAIFGEFFLARALPHIYDECQLSAGDLCIIPIDKSNVRLVIFDVLLFTHVPLKVARSLSDIGFFLKD